MNKRGERARNERIAAIKRRNLARADYLAALIDRNRSEEFRAVPSAHVGKAIVVENHGRVIAQTTVVAGDTDYTVAERLAIAVSRSAP
jgi:hypothetical protein